MDIQQVPPAAAAERSSALLHPTPGCWHMPCSSTECPLSGASSARSADDPCLNLALTWRSRWCSNGVRNPEGKRQCQSRQRIAVRGICLSAKAKLEHHQKTDGEQPSGVSVQSVETGQKLPNPPVHFMNRSWDKCW